MNILITGINGFIGKNLWEHLNNDDFRIMAIVKKKNKDLPKSFKIINRNIENLKRADINIIKKFKPEVVLNLAWQGIPNFSYQNSIINLKMHINFINKLIEISTIKKIIMTGSCWEYMENTGRCKENSQGIPKSYFVWSKNSIHNYYKIISKIHNIKLVWFRIFFVYGKYQRRNSLIPSIINSLKHSKKPQILNPSNKNDFIHIDDVCRAIITAIKKKNIYGIFNIGSGSAISVEKIYNKILFKLTLKKKLFQLNKNNNKKSSSNFADLNKVSSKLKWFPKINIDKGLEKMVNFYNGQIL